jgi:hypothetical protein
MGELEKYRAFAAYSFQIFQDTNRPTHRHFTSTSTLLKERIIPPNSG